MVLHSKQITKEHENEMDEKQTPSQRVPHSQPGQPQELEHVGSAS